MEFEDNENIVLCFPHEIRDYEKLAEDFIRDMFGREYSDCSITDASELSDFFPDGAPDGVLRDGAGLAEQYAAWDDWVLKTIRERYGVELSSTHRYLITILAQMQKMQPPPKERLH